MTDEGPIIDSEQLTPGLDPLGGVRPDLLCLYCRQKIAGMRKKRRLKYCSNICQLHHDKGRTGRVSHSWRDAAMRSTSATGAAHELLVAVDLLARSFMVFRNICSEGFDLAAFYGDITLRIEVKTGSFGKHGEEIRGTQFRPLAPYDVLATVFPGGHITYEPELEKIVLTKETQARYLKRQIGSETAP